MNRPDDLPASVDGETQRLNWVMRNAKRRVLTAGGPIGPSIARELSPRNLRLHAERNQIEAAVLAALDEKLRGLVQVESIRGSTLYISVAPPLTAFEMRACHEREVLERVRNTRAGRQVRTVRYRRSEP